MQRLHLLFILIVIFDPKRNTKSFKVRDTEFLEYVVVVHTYSERKS